MVDLGSAVGATHAVCRLPSGRVLADGVADWNIAFNRISEWIGPRGAFHLKMSGDSLFTLQRAHGLHGDSDSADDSDAFDGGEYGVIIQTDSGRGFNLTIMDEDGQQTFRPAQKCKTAGFVYNFPVYLQEWIMSLEKEEPQYERWGKMWPESLLAPRQCKHCKLITTVLGANLLEWPCHLTDQRNCCLTCCGADDAINCARCEGIILGSEDSPNIRAQDDDLIWCDVCSVTHSGNFSGG